MIVRSNPTRVLAVILAASIALSGWFVGEGFRRGRTPSGATPGSDQALLVQGEEEATMNRLETWMSRPAGANPAQPKLSPAGW